MATALSISNIDAKTESPNSIFTTFSLLWLDVDKRRIPYYLEARKKLYSIIDCIEDFEHIDPCENFIKQATDQRHHIVVVGKNSTQEFIPSLHSYEQVSTFYIYNVDDHAIDNDWMKLHPKVRNLKS